MPPPCSKRRADHASPAAGRRAHERASSIDPRIGNDRSRLGTGHRPLQRVVAANDDAHLLTVRRGLVTKHDQLRKPERANESNTREVQHQQAPRPLPQHRPRGSEELALGRHALDRRARCSRPDRCASEITALDLAGSRCRSDPPTPRYASRKTVMASEKAKMHLLRGNAFRRHLTAEDLAYSSRSA
jgi:hypothetical protein